jgi:hypothetical protein
MVKKRLSSPDALLSSSGDEEGSVIREVVDGGSQPHHMHQHKLHPPLHRRQIR